MIKAITRIWKYIKIIFVVLFIIGFLVPENRTIPVKNATSKDWNKDTFWYEPWGASGVHKGIDIFATKGTPIVATTNLFVLYQGTLSKGGKIVIALGPKWRIHYFAHLSNFKDDPRFLLSKGTEFGYVGNTGNARGKQAHLHYSIISLLPMLWLIDSSTQGYKKIFYLNPIEYLM
jgi:murein DD-endopeptidase MepM/ murein hydrolase activator NlpD